MGMIFSRARRFGVLLVGGRLRRVLLADRARVVFGVCLALPVALVAPAAASAAAPQSYSFSGTNSDVVHCATFDDNFTDVFSGTGKIYFDAAGDPVRVIEHDISHSTDTNSVTGLTLHEHDRATLIVDLVAGQYSFRGGPLRMNRRGEGIVIHDTGIVVFDADNNILFEGGPHQSLSEGDQAFCDALG